MKITTGKITIGDQIEQSELPGAKPCELTAPALVMESQYPSSKVVAKVSNLACGACLRHGLKGIRLETDELSPPFAAADYPRFGTSAVAKLIFQCPAQEFPPAAEM